MLIFRYFCREIFIAVSSITLIMLIILLVGQAAAYLRTIANGGAAISFFSKFMLINVPFLITYVLPFAFYFGLLIVYGRFYADSEMVVMQASGFSHSRLFFYSMSIALVIMMLMAYLVFIADPTLVSKRGKILAYSKANILQTLVPGQFTVLNGGELILYAAKATHDKTHLQNVFFAQLHKTDKQPRHDQWTVNFVAEAHRVVNDNGHAYLQTTKGYLYKGIPGDLDYNILKYRDYSYLLKDDTISGDYDRLDGMPTAQLWLQRGDVLALSELEWRVSLVLEVLILTLFAIPLSRVQPRQGRYTKFLPAVLFYLVYINMLFVARYLLENNMVGAHLGLWWAHLFMLIIIGIYYARVYHLLAWMNQ